MFMPLLGCIPNLYYIIYFISFRTCDMMKFDISFILKNKICTRMNKNINFYIIKLPNDDFIRSVDCDRKL